MSVGLDTIANQGASIEPILWTNRQESQAQIAFNLVDELVARTYKIPKTSLHARTRCRKNVAFCRQVAMYLAHVCLSYPVKQVANHYNRDRTTVAYACRIVEERREGCDIDLLLNSLESALETMMLLAPLSCGRAQ